MAGIYSFIRGIPGKLGVGVADAGFERSNTLPIYSQYGPTYNVRRCLGPTRQSYAMLTQNVPTVSELGSTGLSLHGVILLGSLAQKGN